MRLDSRETFPSGMEEYLGYYGWHFSKKMCEWAVSRMYKKGTSGKKQIVPYTRETFEEMINRYNSPVPFSYDALYVANMCKADFLESSIPDEQHLMLYVRNVIEDVDGYDELVFTRFYADCIGNGTPIDWEDML